MFYLTALATGNLEHATCEKTTVYTAGDKTNMQINSSAIAQLEHRHVTQNTEFYAKNAVHMKPSILS